MVVLFCFPWPPLFICGPRRVGHLVLWTERRFEKKYFTDDFYYVFSPPVFLFGDMDPIIEIKICCSQKYLCSSSSPARTRSLIKCTSINENVREFEIDG